MSEFIRADIGKLENFVSESEEAIKEFSDIHIEFKRINETLIKEWEGEGCEAYKVLSRHITENIGGIETTLTTINEKLLKDVIEKYNSIDKDLAEKNKNYGQSGNSSGG